MEYLMKVDLNRGKDHLVDYVGFVDVKDGVVIGIESDYSKVTKHSSPAEFVDLLQESLTKPLLLAEGLSVLIEQKKKDFPEVKGVNLFICSYVKGGDAEVIRKHRLTAD